MKIVKVVGPKSRNISDQAPDPEQALEIVFIGEKPGRSEGQQEAFRGGQSSERLASLMGYELEEFKRLYTRVNLFSQHSDKWDLRRAQSAARRMTAEVSRDRIFILCGGLVARAFRVDHLHKFVIYRHGERLRYCIIPHPSGLNRWWNDPDHVNLATEFLRRFRR